MGETSRVERTLRRDRLRSRIGPGCHERRPVGLGAAAPGTQPASPTGGRQERGGESNRASGSRGLEHPGAKLVLGHTDDPKPFRSGGLAPDQENALPRDSQRTRNEPQQPRIGLSSFRGGAHVNPKHSVPESADAVARRSGLYPDLHLDVPGTGIAHHGVSVSTGCESRPARSEHHWSTLPACRATASPRS